MSSIKNTILAHVQEEFGGDTEQINTNTPLLSSGIIDSISALELVEFLESTFGFEFQAHEVDQENLDTVDRIEAFVLSKKAIVQ
jgi:D-alanine--poly(phosphoribitol) ligase subunit 2